MYIYLHKSQNNEIKKSKEKPVEAEPEVDKEDEDDDDTNTADDTAPSSSGTPQGTPIKQVNYSNLYLFFELYFYILFSFSFVVVQFSPIF